MHVLAGSQAILSTLPRRAVVAGSLILPLLGCEQQPLSENIQKTEKFKGFDRVPIKLLDVHCHIFNVTDVPGWGFLRFVHFKCPSKAQYRLIGSIGQRMALKLARNGPGGVDHERRYLDQLIAQARFSPAPVAMPSPKDKTSASVLRTIPSAFLGSRFGNLDWLVNRYKRFCSGAIFCTPAIIDYDCWLNPPPPYSPRVNWASRLSVQIDLMERLSVLYATCESGASMHPFVAFDPLRCALDRRGRATPGEPPLNGPRKPDALQLAKLAVRSKGAVGVKLYPPMGFFPLDNKHHDNSVFPPWLPRELGNVGEALDETLLDLFTWCSSEQVPVMAHCSPSQGKNEDYESRAAPENWLPVLRRFPDLRLNLAHFGGIEANETEVISNQQVCGDTRLEVRTAWAGQIVNIMSYYRNVYADTSYFAAALGKEGASTVQRFIDIVGGNSEIRKRIMYGSDWSLVAQEDNAYLYPTKMFKSLEPLLSDPEQLNDYAWNNAAQFLGITAGGKTHERLSSFYKTHGISRLPDFLSDYT